MRAGLTLRGSNFLVLGFTFQKLLCKLFCTQMQVQNRAAKGSVGNPVWLMNGDVYFGPWIPYHSQVLLNFIHLLKQSSAFSCSKSVF